MSGVGATTVTVGVLAIQGAFREHASHLNRCNNHFDSTTIRSTLVRTPEQLAECDALIIPGGESTVISLGCERAALLEPLRRWVREGRPVWGTCAGMIMLAREASGGKKTGQQLLGGVDVRVGRNGFGSQIDSFETGLHIVGLDRADEPFNGVFIRAPVVDALLLPSDLEQVAVDQPTLIQSIDTDAVQDSAATRSLSLTATQPQTLPVIAAPPLYDELNPRKVAQKRPLIQILATLPEPVTSPKSPGNFPVADAVDRDPRIDIAGRPAHDSQIVALRQGNILMTSFHPELTPDSRLHHLFLSSIVLPHAKQHT